MKATSSSMARASAANRWKPSGALASFPTARTCSCGLKGIEYLNFMGDIYDVESSLRAQRIASLAETFEMRDALNDKILSYSHGMRQKIVLMGALIHEPQVWILDEPMTGLDPQSSFHLKQMMKEHAAKGKTVFFSTHVLEVAEKLCDKIAIINHGKIIYFGTLDDLRAGHGDQSLEELFPRGDLSCISCSPSSASSSKAACSTRPMPRPRHGKRHCCIWSC